MLVTRTGYSRHPPTHNPNLNHNVTRLGLPSKSNPIFRGPCAAFAPNLVKIGRAVFSQYAAKLQTDAGET